MTCMLWPEVKLSRRLLFFCTIFVVIVKWMMPSGSFLLDMRGARRDHLIFARDEKICLSFFLEPTNITLANATNFLLGGIFSGPALGKVFPHPRGARCQRLTASQGLYNAVLDALTQERGRTDPTAGVRKRWMCLHVAALQGKKTGRCCE